MRRVFGDLDWRYAPEPTVGKGKRGRIKQGVVQDGRSCSSSPPQEESKRKKLPVLGKEKVCRNNQEEKEARGNCWKFRAGRGREGDTRGHWKERAEVEVEGASESSQAGVTISHVSRAPSVTK